MEKIYFFKQNQAKPISVEFIFDDSNAVLEISSRDEASMFWNYQDLLLEINHTFLTLKNIHHPEYYIHCYDKNIIHKLKVINPNSGSTKWFDRLFSAGIYVHLGITAICISFMALVYFVIMPFIADTIVLKLPTYYDDQLGEQVFLNMSVNSTIDTPRSELLNKFFAKINKDTTRNIEIVVIDYPIQNAYALPDGHIIVYTGILDSMKHYSELAALLGHESAHVFERHSMRILGKNISGYLIVSLVLNDINGAMALLIDNANAIHSLTYSRTFEQESDEKSMQLLMENNIDIEGMRHLIESLKKKEVLSVPEFMSTHPMSDNRIKYLNDFIEKNKDSYVVKEDAELKALFEQMIY